jgi:serine-type D-Ala-D-Ala carboxypeptidase (penicillin-binding protein 5/6)
VDFGLSSIAVMRFKPARIILGVITLLVALLLVNEFRPVAAVAATQSLAGSTTRGSPTDLPWPAQAQAAIGAEGAGVLASTPNAKPLPIASVAKVMTALVTLEAKPLRRGEQGPPITITAGDVSTYQQDQAAGQSVMAVEAGEQLSEHQALEGLLIPSGNNIATLLGNWAFGSTGALVQKMNGRAKELGLTKTHFTDPSGLDASTVSIPADLVSLGETAMKDPVLAEIVAKGEDNLPVAGTVINVNYHLGQNGIVGVKTGSTDQAGAVYLYAGTHKLASGRSLLIFGAVQNLPTLDQAFRAADALLQVVRQNLQVDHVVSRQQTVGRVSAPWGSASDVVASEDLDVLTLPGMVVRSEVRAGVRAQAVSPGTTIGSLHVTAGPTSYDVPVAAAGQIYAPGRLWRAIRVG